MGGQICEQIYGKIKIPQSVKTAKGGKDGGVGEAIVGQGDASDDRRRTGISATDSFPAAWIVCCAPLGVGGFRVHQARNGLHDVSLCCVYRKGCGGGGGRWHIKKGEEEQERQQQMP